MAFCLAHRRAKRRETAHARGDDDDMTPQALITIFQCITLEGWTDIMYVSYQLQDASSRARAAVTFSRAVNAILTPHRTLLPPLLPRRYQLQDAYNPSIVAIYFSMLIVFGAFPT